MINLSVNKTHWDKLLNKIDDEDLSQDDGQTKGKELDPHVTIIYGIHADVPDEDVEAIIDNMTTPDIELKKVSTFETNELFDVLKFDIESEDLKKYNKMLCDLPHTTLYPDYHAHATIAYLKKGKGKKYVDLFNLRPPLNVTPDKIIYSKPVTGSKAKKTYKLKKK
jgi:2'-5' RNA ligase